MSARIARGRGAASRGRPRGARSVSTRRGRRPGLLDRLGLPAGTRRRLGGWLLALLVLAAAVVTVQSLRLPQQAGRAVAEAVGGAGFTMRRVEIRGADRVPRLQVYNIAFDQPSLAMPLVDLDRTRARLLEFGWIKEARVHRRLPDTLVVELVERRPAAIWEHDRGLVLIDEEGVVLEPVRIDAMPDLPQVAGAGANRRLAALQALLAAAPHLRPQVAGANWVGGRRWDLRFQSGELLALPEGEEAARRAILTFARTDQQTQLLGRGFVRFDMRIPGRMIVRVSREPGTSVPALAPPDPPAAAEALSRTI